jgi:PTS system mannose-specific IIC component
MFLIQSVLVALLCVLGSVATPSYGFTLGWYVLSRPLIGGFLCGIIFGDVAQGIILGAVVQAAYLAVVTPGGSFPAELGFISYPAMGIALAAHMDPGTTVALAATIGVLGTFVLTLTMIINSYFTGMSDKAIEKGDTTGVVRTFLIYPQLVQLVTRGVPAFLAVYFGSQYIQQVIDMMPQFVVSGMMNLGGILPALGVALLLAQSMNKKSFLLFFMVGFISVVFIKMNMIAVVVFGATLAYLYYMINEAKAGKAVTLGPDEEEVL